MKFVLSSKSDKRWGKKWMEVKESRIPHLCGIRGLKVTIFETFLACNPLFLLGKALLLTILYNFKQVIFYWNGFS